MSIDGIRMGRIPKSEKLKSFNELENSGILLVFIIKYQLFNLINAKYKLNKFLKLFFNWCILKEVNKEKSNEFFQHRDEFLVWFNEQIESCNLKKQKKSKFKFKLVNI